MILNSRPIPLIVISTLTFLIGLLFFISTLISLPAFALVGVTITEALLLLLVSLFFVISGVYLWKQRITGLYLLIIGAVTIFLKKVENLYVIKLHPNTYTVTFYEQLKIDASVALLFFISITYLFSIKKQLK